MLIFFAIGLVRGIRQYGISVMKENYVSAGECGCGCVDSGSGKSVAISTSGPISAPTTSSKTAHTKVATSGGHANTQGPSKRSSSGADGDYQLVQHEVLYSQSAEYEVSFEWNVLLSPQ